MITINDQRVNLITAVVGAFGFYCFAWLAIDRGHFHEDAYILFKYVENIVDGYGISFSPGLGPAEGATDFLWMMCLVVLHYFGLSVGIATILVSTVGVFSTLYFLGKLTENNDLLVKIGLGVLALTLLLTGLTYAAGGGFSVWAYTGIIMPMLFLFLRASKEYWHWIPILSLMLGLLRPDGLIIGAIFTLISVYELRDSQKLLRKFLISGVIAFFIGASYFVWRISYFDALLPLPLLVKSETSHLFEGWGSNFAWAAKNWVLLVLSISVVTTLRMIDRANSSIRLIVLAGLPFIVHLIALGFAHQSQNVGFRFQAPQLVYLYAILLMTLSAYSEYIALKRTRVIACIALSGIFAVTGVAETRQSFRNLAGRNYVNVFPLWLNDLLPKGTLIAVTEAGRLPFWATNYQYIDLVGLNTPRIAQNGLDVEYLESLKPTLLMLWYDTGEKEGMSSSVSIAELEQLNSNYKRKVKNGHQPTTVTASIVTADFLLQSGQYDVISARYWNSHNHLYAFRKGSVDIELVKRKITEFSMKSNHFSYLEMQEIVDSAKPFSSLYEAR